LTKSGYRERIGPVVRPAALRRDDEPNYRPVHGRDVLGFCLEKGIKNALNIFQHKNLLWENTKLMSTVAHATPYDRRKARFVLTGL